MKSNAVIEIQDKDLNDILSIVEKKDSTDKLYLHFAVMRGDIGLVNYLISSGESALKKDKEGITPLMIASRERYGKGYDIFIALVKAAQKEIKSHNDGRHYPQLIKDCSTNFSKPLLNNLEEYTDEILERNKIIKFFSVVFGQDKTLDRNSEQAEIYESLYQAEVSKNYLALYNSIDRQWDVDESSLHKRVEESRLQGKKIFPDYEHVVRYREVMEEVRKQKPLNFNQRMIKKINDAVLENKNLSIENKALSEKIDQQNIEIKELKSNINNMSVNFDKKFIEMQEMIISINSERLMRKPSIKPEKKTQSEPSSNWWPMFDFASDEKKASSRSLPDKLPTNQSTKGNRK